MTFQFKGTHFLGDKTRRFFLSFGGVVARSKAINFLHLVAATVERHDRNSGCRPVELSLLSFILGIHLAYDVNLGLELASEHSAGFPVTSDRQTSIAHCRGTNGGWADD